MGSSLSIAGHLALSEISWSNLIVQEPMKTFRDTQEDLHCESTPSLYNNFP